MVEVEVVRVERQRPSSEGPADPPSPTPEVTGPPPGDRDAGLPAGVEGEDRYALVLRARGSARVLHMVIGTPEAAAIELGRTGQRLPRPMTHDFTSALLEALDDVTVLRVVLTERVEGAYRAAFVLRHGREVVEVDCRPCDAIAVAVRLDVPIVAADPVEALFTAA